MKLSRQISPEDLANEYAVQMLVWHDEAAANQYLDLLRPSAANLLKNYQIEWSDQAEQLLKDACLHYDIYSRVLFLSYFETYVERQYHLRDLQQQETEQSYFYSEGVRGNGCGTFQRTRTSSPERITLERME